MEPLNHPDYCKFPAYHQLRYHVEVRGPNGYAVRKGLPGTGKAVSREYARDGFSSSQKGRYREDRIWRYKRRRPERTLFYKLIAEHYPHQLLELLDDQGRSLPEYVRREFDDFLKRGILDHGSLRLRCQDCHDERLVPFSWSLLRIPAPATLVIPFTLQTARFLPELRRPADS